MAIIVDTGSQGSVFDFTQTAANRLYTGGNSSNTLDPFGPDTGNVSLSDINAILAGVRPPSKTGSGGGGRGGGGYDYADPNIGSRIRDDLIFWFGEPWVQANSSVVAWHLQNKSTAADVRRYAVDNGANGAGMQQLRSVLSRSLAGLLGSNVSSALPDSIFRTLIRDGSYEDADTLSAAILGLKNIGWDKVFDPKTGAPALEPFFDRWEEMTGGANFGPTAANKLQEIVQQYGYGDEAFAAFTRWVETTNSAKSGNWGADHRVSIKAKLEPLLGRLLTPEELSPDGPLWDLSDAALYEYAQKTPEYQAKFAMKPVGVSESQYLADVAAWDVVWRQAYGVDTAAASGMPGTFAQPQLTPEGQAAMERAGFSTFAEWEQFAGGQPGWFEDRAEASGWIVPGTATGVAGSPNELIAWGYENGVGPEEWMQHVQWEQQAIVAEGTYDPILMETLGVNLSQDDWYKYTSKAIGWGEIQLQIMEAQNKMDYREVFRNYTGRDPSPSDYDYLSTNFVSPNEYARRMAAKESAAEMLPQANELLNRIFGRGTTLSELENLAMGGQGSGALRAQLNQATRLEQYRWTHKQNYGTEPTPSDYARYAGYAGPAELQWELNLAEDLGEFGPDIQEVWKKVYNEDISEEELRIMLGDMKGSGDLKYRYKQAKEKVDELEQAHEAGFTTPGAMQLYGAAEQGGFKTVMKGVADL